MSKFLKKPMCYVVARTASSRAALQHIVKEVGDRYTVCGYDMATWTRWYMATQLSVLLCKKCQRIANVDVQEVRRLRIVS